MLDLYRIIREERLKRDWSQQHLAELVGYKGKSMIAQIEKGNVDLPSTMITKFAEVFNVTESYLMGWNEEDDNTIHLPSDIELLIQRYEESDETTRDIIRKILGIKNESC